MSGSDINISKLLDGQIVLVTGAGQGNGRAIAQGVARSGARVVVTDVLVEMAELDGARDTLAGVRSDGAPSGRYRCEGMCLGRRADWPRDGSGERVGKQRRDHNS